MSDSRKPAGRFELPVTISLRDGSLQDGEVYEELEYDGHTPIVVGRGDDCAIKLVTSRASRQHIQIFGEDGFLTVLDLQSANGTYFGDERISRLELSPGDTIRIGSSTLLFEEAQPSAAVPPPEASARARTAAAEAQALESQDEDSQSASADDEGSSAQPRRRVLRPAAPVASPLARSIALAIPAILLICVAVVVTLQVTERGGLGFRPRPDGGADSDLVDQRGSDRGEGSSSSDPGSAPSAELQELEALARTDLDDYAAQIGEGDFDWSLARDLEQLAGTYAGTQAADEMRLLSRFLGSIQPVIEAEQRAGSEIALGQLIRERKFGEATIAARFLARRHEQESDESGYWLARAEQIESQAQSELLELEQQLGSLVESGDADSALKSLIAAREYFAGTAAYSALLPSWLDGSIKARASERRPVNERLERRRERIAAALAECRFRDLEPLYHELLGFDLSAEERLGLNQDLVSALYYRQLFDEFLAGWSSSEVRIGAGRLLRANSDEVEFERVVGEQKYTVVLAWRKLSPVTQLDLFQSVVKSRDGLVGVVLFAMQSGNDFGTERALVRLHKREKGRELATILAARRRGIPVPTEGFVVHRDRLVTPSEKAGMIAARESARRREKELLAELRLKKVSSRLDAYIDTALELRQQKKFSIAQRALEEISEKGEGEVAARAQRLIDDPFLAIDNLRQTGPSADRIDIVVLGEGYPIEDDYQAQFLIQANRLVSLLTKEEPYREYESYLNFWGVQLGSKDKGCDRTPGGVLKDTALGGKVEWDRFTVDNGLVMKVLGNLGEAGGDRQAIVIGLDTAGVATGGGGVACMTVGNYTVAGHEVGHSFGSLHDEYDFEPGTDPNRTPPVRKPNMRTQFIPPNLMAGSDRADVLAKTSWRYWIEAGEDKWWNGGRVEVFEGGNRQPFNFWRPQQNCKMRNAASRMCVVCMEHMVLEIYRYVRPIERVEPSEERVALESRGRQIFKVWPMMPATHDLEARWFLKDLGSNEPVAEKKTGGTRVRDKTPGEIFKRVLRYVDPQGRIVHAAEVRTSGLEKGWYRLTVEVKDPTPWVIRDLEERLVQRREWLIQVE